MLTALIIMSVTFVGTVYRTALKLMFIYLCLNKERGFMGNRGYTNRHITGKLLILEISPKQVFILILLFKY